MPLAVTQPSAAASSPAETADAASLSAPAAEAIDPITSASTPATEIPSLAMVASVGEIYLAIDISAESLTPSGLDQIRSQLAQHLGMSKANIALNMLSGSVVLQVTLSGERVDGARLAQQLETDVMAGRLSSVVVGYVPPNAQVCS